MDDLTDLDATIGQLKVAVLVPTCGEKVSVMLKALFGNLQLRSGTPSSPSILKKALYFDLDVRIF